MQTIAVMTSHISPLYLISGSRLLTQSGYCGPIVGVIKLNIISLIFNGFR